MKLLTINHLAPFSVAGLLAVLTLFSLGCERRKVEDLQPASFPAKGTVFLDDFTPDLVYAAFGGSDVRAFQVDRTVAYNNSLQSMRFDVPDPESPNGSYAGGVFMSSSGRDLSGFNALTFYIRASRPVSIGSLGFGNDFGANKYLVTMSGLSVTSNWIKVVIPIPDPSKLTAERGLFYFAASPEGNGDRGFTFWVDEVKFERVGNLGIPQSQIQNGANNEVGGAEVGQRINLTGFSTTVSLPTGVNQTVDIAPGYFNFISSDTSVATVNEAGQVSIIASGNATITANINKQTAAGSLRITSTGGVARPTVPAPRPTRPAADVISMYSNVYTNVPVDRWNTYWEFSTAVEEMIQIQGDDVIRYRNLNFVGIEFTSQKINATNMDGFHLDIWTPDNTALPNNFKILLVDFGANGQFGGGDDRSHEITVTAPTLVSNNWVSLDLPLSSFTGLTTRANLAQLVLSGSIPNVFVDNVYFYKSNQSTSPTTPAPTPTFAAGGVLSLFSDAYTNLAGVNLNPNWGQATVVSQTPIGGNNTMVYTGLNYQGLEFGSEQNVSNKNFLHIDYFSANSLSLKVFLLSPGIPFENEVSFTLPVPTTSGWNSVDIPLSHFTPTVDLNRAYQLKFEGNGTIYLDNILFRE